MLAYAFQVLKHSNYEKVAAEEFENVHDLLAAILAKGIAQQLKQGLHREYIAESGNLSTMRGKLDIRGTICNKLQRRQKLSCEYDELTENNTFNQILNTTATILLKHGKVKPEHKTELRKIALFFNKIDTIRPECIKWGTLNCRRNNQSYKMLLNICFLTLEGLLLSKEKGEYKLASFLDEQKMSRLYEKFVLEYYRYHYPKLKPSASNVRWNLDEGAIDFLPIMKTDVTLSQNDKTLIIDAKYYAKTMETYFDKKGLHSNNLYQIFTYVKNKDVTNTGNVSGMLLYAKTKEEVTPDCEFIMGGNKISVKTLDLNAPFSCIKRQLDKIAESYFGITVAGKAT